MAPPAAGSPCENERIMVRVLSLPNGCCGRGAPTTVGRSKNALLFGELTQRAAPFSIARTVVHLGDDFQ